MFGSFGKRFGHAILLLKIVVIFNMIKLPFLIGISLMGSLKANMLTIT
jgi:hypothetical protein